MNRDTVQTCRSCGRPLVTSLRGRYEPVKLIGRGGFGRTYLAQDSDRLNAPCVIKQFAPQTQSPKAFDKAVELFTQEAVRLHDLGEHPQIPALLAYFEHEHYLYLVQQFIDGKTLIQEMVEHGPLDESEIRALLTDTLPVLDFIHCHSVIHRDITPTNLIRRETDRRLFLIDFGIAKQFGEALSAEPGTRIGTEGYAPIEQLRSGQAYPSSDLYSLGATCMHLLTGQKPDSLYDPVEARWCWREALDKQGRSLSEELGQVLDRLVLDRVGDRYPSAQAVLDALDQLPKLAGTVPAWVRQNTSGQGTLAAAANVRPSAPPDLSPPAYSPATRVSSPHDMLNTPATTPPNFEVETEASPAAAATMPVSAPFGEATLSRREAATLGNRGHCVRVLTGHQSWVTTVAFNPRTATLVSGSLDDTIKNWNLQTGDPLLSLTAHARGVNQVVISPKGQVLVSCGDDSTIKVWNLVAGRLIHSLEGHMRGVSSVAIGQQGWILASGSKDKTIKLWKLDKGTSLKTLLGSPAAVRAVAITPDETALLSGGLDNKVRLWDLKTGENLRIFSGHTSPVNAVAVSSDGLFAASASKDTTVLLWSLRTGAIIHALKDHAQEVNSVAIAPDNRTLVSGSSDSTVKIWDAKTGQLRDTLLGHTHTVTAIAIHRTGRFIASASADKTIRIWRLG